VLKIVSIEKTSQIKTLDIGMPMGPDMDMMNVDMDIDIDTDMDMDN
jgi:hypothetical protein